MKEAGSEVGKRHKPLGGGQLDVCLMVIKGAIWWSCARGSRRCTSPSLASLWAWRVMEQYEQHQGGW